MGLRDELEQVRADYGRLDPDIVITAAAPKNHPLHNRFEWDNRKAGHEYRRIQAHQLIQAVRISIMSGDGPRNLRAYVAVPQPDRNQPDYQPLEEVAEDPFVSKLILQQAEREWQTLKQRYGHLAEFIELVQRDLGAA